MSLREYFLKDRPIKVYINDLNPPREDLTNGGYLILRREKHMNSLQIFNIAAKRNDLFFVFKMGRTRSDRFKLQQR